MGVILTGDMIRGAQETQAKYGVPASITLGQIMLESGGSYSGGLSGLAYNYNNLFGIKGSGTAGTVYLPTYEEGQGTITDGFARYNNFAESIEAHGKLLSTDLYTQYTKNATTVEEYAKAIHKAGYATSSTYADTLIKIINENNLKQYDSGVFVGTGVSSSDDSLKWYGDIAVIIFIVILIVIGVLLFVGAFSSNNPVTEVKKKVGKIRGKKK